MSAASREPGGGARLTLHLGGVSVMREVRLGVETLALLLAHPASARVTLLPG